MKKQTKFSTVYFLILLAGILMLENLFFSAPAGKEISYSKFRSFLEKDSVKSVIIESEKIYGITKHAIPVTQNADKEENSSLSADSGKKTESDKVYPLHKSHSPWRLNIAKQKQEYQEQVKHQFTVVRLEDPELLDILQAHGVDYRGKIESNFFKNLFYNWIIPFGLLFMLWGFLFRRMSKGPNFLNIGKNKAKIFEVDPSIKVTFNEVAGIDEAVEEVKEVVSFLKNPEKFTRLGAKLPKGVLLVGPPGTGKTLLARAVAGEAGVAFFNISGSEFVEMFVGLGAARVRDLFVEARQKAPCVIFIDELDAIGKNRGGAFPYGAGFDERENTLNQILVEMDGFDPQRGIVIIAATNRPEVLDRALLRPGRFDRQILVDRPDLNGREQIFKVHTSQLPLDQKVDLRKLAAETPGFVGADIANICNEAALLASRLNKNTIGMNDFRDAIERVIAGLEKKNKLINSRERKIVAYHESGHAIVGYFTPGADPVQKVSIIPRGIGALGYTLQTPLEDRYLMTQDELLSKVKGLLGGRAAEEVIFGEISTGASNDLEKVTKIVRDMLTVYGMSKHIPNVSLVQPDTNYFLIQDHNSNHYSEKVSEMLDEEVLQIINDCYQEDKMLLEQKREYLIKMAEYLLEKEKIDEQDIVKILGPRNQLEQSEKNTKINQIFQ